MDTQKLHALFLLSTGVSTDTRTLQKGNLYFALSGENFDGNEFTDQALDKGAKHAIINDTRHEVNGKTMLVDDPLETLQKLATYHRDHLYLPIIALTGSNGKTTTKELINAVLSKKYTTIATQGNYNNHIGVPLTLLRMTAATEMGIVEMGANHLKEIELLCKIAKPNFGYITNFGKAHLEGFGGVEGVIKGKSELYDHLRAHKGMAFINVDDAKQVKQAEGISSFTFGKREDNDLLIVNTAADKFARVTLKDYQVDSQLIGSYNSANISAAIAMGTYFQVPTGEIKNAIAAYIPSNNRSQLLKKGKATIIMDAYNANPTSMAVALVNFKNLTASHKILFLGDMFELGPTASSEHEHIAKMATEISAAHTIFLGAHFKEVKIAKDNLYYFKNTEDFQHNIPEKLKRILKHEVHILIKGSRGMAMERLLPVLEKYIEQ